MACVLSLPIPAIAVSQVQLQACTLAYAGAARKCIKASVSKALTAAWIRVVWAPVITCQGRGEPGRGGLHEVPGHQWISRDLPRFGPIAHARDG